jgi:hypothetical protein
MSTDTVSGGVALFLLNSTLGLGKIPLDTRVQPQQAGAMFFHQALEAFFIHFAGYLCKIHPPACSYFNR